MVLKILSTEEQSIFKLIHQKIILEIITSLIYLTVKYLKLIFKKIFIMIIHPNLLIHLLVEILMGTSI